MSSTIREISKTHWTSDGNNLEIINAGSLQRIADASEIMAKGFLGLQDERDRYKRWYESEKQSNIKSKYRIIALKGHITKLKKQLLASKQSAEVAT